MTEVLDPQAIATNGYSNSGDSLDLLGLASMGFLNSSDQPAPTPTPETRKRRGGGGGKGILLTNQITKEQALNIHFEIAVQSINGKQSTDEKIIEKDYKSSKTGNMEFKTKQVVSDKNLASKFGVEEINTESKPLKISIEAGKVKVESKGNIVVSSSIETKRVEPIIINVKPIIIKHKE